jgi:hypothetical protein
LPNAALSAAAVRSEHLPLPLELPPEAGWDVLDAGCEVLPPVVPLFVAGVPPPDDPQAASSVAEC